jgi:hypothetical protein
MTSVFNDKDVNEALSLIEGTKLPHPSGKLLSSFIIEALNPRLTAQYILQACPSDGTQEADILSIASDGVISLSQVCHPSPVLSHSES